MKFFWRKKAEQNSLEKLVESFEDIRKQFDDFKSSKDEELKKIKEEKEAALLELKKYRDELSRDDINKKIIIHFYPGKELFVLIDGDAMYSKDYSQETFEKLKELKDKSDIIGIKKLLNPDFIDEIGIKENEVEKNFNEKKALIEVDNSEESEIENVVDGVRALIATGDFVVEEDVVKMKGINRSIPKLLVDKFLELHLNDNKERYEAWKNFWRWIVLNPNAEATESFYDIMKRYNVEVTKEGFILAYRWVESLPHTNKNTALIEFVSNSYAKVKKWKKAPRNFYIIQKQDETDYTLTTGDKNDESNRDVMIGNLAELHSKLDELQGEQMYTDCYSQTMKIVLGKEVLIDRASCDESNKSCSRGLHQCFKLSDHSGNGDTKIVIAVCPRDIINVPAHGSKFRSCRYLPLAVLQENEDDRNFVINDEGLNLLEDYFDFKVEELNDQSSKLTVKELTQQRLLPRRLYEVFTPEKEEEEVEIESKMEVASIIESFEDQLSNRIKTIS